jgi:hypothetical protein
MTAGSLTFVGTLLSAADFRTYVARSNSFTSTIHRNPALLFISIMHASSAAIKRHRHLAAIDTLCSQHKISDRRVSPTQRS